MNIGKTWPLQHKGERSRTQLTAVVKGAGPGALAAAVTLAQEGFAVKLAGIRSRNVDGGRRNVVVLRPEAMRQLDNLGAVDVLERSGKLQRNGDFRIINEWTGKDFAPPQVDYKAPDYVPPLDRKDHFTTHMVCLGDLEDALETVARDLGVDIRHESTIHLQRAGGTKRYRVSLTPSTPRTGAEDLGFPDLVVGASGKHDADLDAQLGVQRHRGVKVDLVNLPQHGTRELRLGAEKELEAQKFVVFGFNNSALADGTFHMRVRKAGEGARQQPLNEFKFGHLGVTTLLLQLPRELNAARQNVEPYVLERTNQHLGTTFDGLGALTKTHPIAWGDPSRAFDVETQTAHTFVYGSNVVLLGDRALSCSPSSGIGAEIAATLDSLNIRQLATDLKTRCFAKAAGNLASTLPRSDALTHYNARKAASLELWSRASRPFYLTREAAQAIAT